jgi:hypothetical protein
MIGSPRRCSHCGSTLIRRSYTRDWARTLCALLFLQPYRCRTCGRRIWRFGAPAPRPVRKPQPVMVAAAAGEPGSLPPSTDHHPLIPPAEA